MKIDNVRVYGLEESIVASGYPMSTEILKEKDFKVNCDFMNYGLDYGTEDFNESSKKEFNNRIKRAKTLAGVKTGTGHDCYLKGIIIQADVTAPQYWWLQYGRYHFADIISSQSKMHRITKMDIDQQCNEYVGIPVIEYLKEWIRLYNEYDPNFMPVITIRGQKFEYTKENIFKIITSNTPMGLNLTARITTNYLQLKTIYYQRKNHKLDEWSKIFCKWVGELPMFKELVLGE